MPLWVRRVRYLQATLGAFDLDWLTNGRVPLPGVTLSDQLPEDLVESVNRIDTYLGLKGADESFLLGTSPEGGDLSTLGEEPHPLRVVPLGLLLTLNPNLRFGPLIAFERADGEWRATGCSYDSLFSVHGPFRRLPTHFFDYDHPPSYDYLTLVIAGVLRASAAPVFRMSCERYVRACYARTRDSAIVELSIALEVLLALNDRRKRRTLASRAALLLGRNAADREEVYRNIGSLYLIRNSVMHEGRLGGAVQLANGRRLEPTTIVRAGRRHVAEIIRALACDTESAWLDKRAFLSQLDAGVDLIADELSLYESELTGHLRT